MFTDIEKARLAELKAKEILSDDEKKEIIELEDKEVQY